MSFYTAETIDPLAPAEAGSKSPRILILRAGAIGDTLMVTPVVRALRQCFPQATLIFVCSRSAYEVLRYNPHLDEVVPLAYRRWPVWMSFEKMRIIRRFRRQRLDWVLALESHPRLLDLVPWLGAERLITYGVPPGAKQFERASFDPKRHSIENHVRAAELLGVKTVDLSMELHYPPSLDGAVCVRLARAGIRQGDCLVGVHPGWGGRKHPIEDTRLRSWPPERFGRLIQWLNEARGVKVVLTGAGEDGPLTEYIARLAGAPCVNLAGQLSLLELAALIRRLNLYLTVDSGPAHIAGALGTPLAVLWGPGIYEQTAPLAGRGPVRILRHPVPCAPCYGTPLMNICKDNICMKEIEVEEVQVALEEMFASADRREVAATEDRSAPRPRA